MKITLVKEQIIDGLQKAANILPMRTGAAYLRSIWIKAEMDHVLIMATDANIEFCGKYAAEVEEGGLIGVQGRAFVDLIKQLPNGNIKLHLDAANGHLLIEQGRRKYKLPANDAAWFQNFSDFPTENSVVWTGDFFQDILEKITFCISDEDGADAISCLYMKAITSAGGTSRIEFCGLNGHQFALVSFSHDELSAIIPAEGILLQKKYLQEMKKWLGTDEIEININEKRFYVRTLNSQELLSLPRATYNYPDYNLFLEKIRGNNSVLHIDRKECAEALGRISIFNTNNNRCTYFELNETEAILTTQGKDVGSANEGLEVIYKGDIKNIAFPSKDLLDIMNHFTSDQLTMTLTGTEGPCAIQGKNDPDYTVIVMPMKIAENSNYNDED